MKLKICLLLLILGCGSSLVVFSQPVKPQNANQALPPEIIQLRHAIKTANYDPQERNSSLRYQRALLYYVSAKQHVQLNWRKQAVDDAQRGIKLLKMNQTAERAKTDVADAVLTEAQQYADLSVG
ncbi:hypothetical protein [Paraglaciecola sp.]|uniref:hypothetical protein n=1 Tax=Paraglaciecola sp. TaxID=1920173 RepID=UPI0030F39884